MVEEVATNKEVGERAETVRDTVCRTEVDVSDIDDIEARRGRSSAG